MGCCALEKIKSGNDEEDFIRDVIYSHKLRVLSFSEIKEKFEKCRSKVQNEEKSVQFDFDGEKYNKMSDELWDKDNELTPYHKAIYPNLEQLEDLIIKNNIEANFYLATFSYAKDHDKYEFIKDLFKAMGENFKVENAANFFNIYLKENLVGINKRFLDSIEPCIEKPITVNNITINKEFYDKCNTLLEKYSEVVSKFALEIFRFFIDIVKAENKNISEDELGSLDIKESWLKDVENKYRFLFNGLELRVNIYSRFESEKKEKDEVKK